MHYPDSYIKSSLVFSVYFPSYRRHVSSLSTKLVALSSFVMSLSVDVLEKVRYAYITNHVWAKARVAWRGILLLAAPRSTHCEGYGPGAAAVGIYVAERSATAVPCEVTSLRGSTVHVHCALRTAHSRTQSLCCHLCVCCLCLCRRGCCRLRHTNASTTL